MDLKKRTKIVIKSKVIDEELELMDVHTVVKGDIKIAINAIVTAAANLLIDTGEAEKNLELFIRDLKKEVRR